MYEPTPLYAVWRACKFSGLVVTRDYGRMGTRKKTNMRFLL